MKTSKAKTVMLKHCKLSEVEAGMVLAVDICDPQGHRLMNAGTELNETILARLQKRDIETLMVWQEQSLSETEIAVRRDAITSSLAHRFRKVQDNADMRHLHGILLAWRLQDFVETDNTDNNPGPEN